MMKTTFLRSKDNTAGLNNSQRHAGTTCAKCALESRVEVMQSHARHGCNHLVYLSVKATRSQQGSVQHIWPVGGSQHDDSSVALKAVHLCEQLVDGLLTLIIAAAHACATLSAHGINLIYEDDAGSLGLGLQ